MFPYLQLDSSYHLKGLENSRHFSSNLAATQSPGHLAGQLTVKSGLDAGKKGLGGMLCALDSTASALG